MQQCSFERQAPFLLFIYAHISIGRQLFRQIIQNKHFIFRILFFVSRSTSHEFLFSGKFFFLFARFIPHTHSNLMNFWCSEKLSQVETINLAASSACLIITKGGSLLIHDELLPRQHVHRYEIMVVKQAIFWWLNLSSLNVNDTYKNIFRSFAHCLRCCFALFSLLSFLYDYDESIGMCSHLIILNLTRASSGNHRLHAASIVHCRKKELFLSVVCVSIWHAAGNENSDRSVFILTIQRKLFYSFTNFHDGIRFQIATLRVLHYLR